MSLAPRLEFLGEVRVVVGHVPPAFGGLQAAFLEPAEIHRLLSSCAELAVAIFCVVAWVFLQSTLGFSR